MDLDLDGFFVQVECGYVGVFVFCVRGQEGVCYFVVYGLLGFQVVCIVVGVVEVCLKLDGFVCEDYVFVVVGCDCCFGCGIVDVYGFVFVVGDGDGDGEEGWRSYWVIFVGD